MSTTCSELVVFMYWSGKSKNIFLSYCGLVDAKIRASKKDLPVSSMKKFAGSGSLLVGAFIDKNVQ